MANNFQDIGDEEEFKWAQDPEDKAPAPKVRAKQNDAIQVVVQMAQAEFEEARIAADAAKKEE